MDSPDSQLQEMNIQCFTGGFTATNGYLLSSKEGDNQSPVLIDAPEGISQWLDSQGVTPAALLLTHQHFDHIWDIGELLKRFPDLPIYAHSAYREEFTLGSMVGVDLGLSPFSVKQALAGEETLEVAGWNVELRYLPGHSRDSLCFYFTEQAVVFSGDTLMAGGEGRSDLPGGSRAQLASGIGQQLFTLPEQTQVFPGHGPKTSIGVEKASNPIARLIS